MAVDFTRHISFTSCNDIQEICAPLFSRSPISMLEYSRVYFNGSRTELVSNPAFFVHSLNSGIFSSRNKVHTPILLPKMRFLFMFRFVETFSSPIKKRIQAQLCLEKEFFGVEGQVTLINYTKSYDEYFQFYISNPSISTENFFINNTDSLENFAVYFVDKAHEIIQQADRDRLVKPWRDPKLDKIAVHPEQLDPRRFSQALRTRRFYLTIDQREVYLTEQEIKCAQLLVQGKSAAEIAIILGKSRRTIETQLAMIRDKTDCASRSELIALLIKNNFGKIALI